MNSRSLRSALVVSAVVVGIASAGVHSARARANWDREPIVLTPSEIHWDARADGVRVAVLHGDPTQPGPFALRLEYPAGYRKAPHIHPNDAYVTVLEGRYFRGYGNDFDESAGVELTPGTFSVNPGGVSHYEWATQRAVLQVHAVGPWTTTYVNGHDPDSER